MIKLRQSTAQHIDDTNPYVQSSNAFDSRRIERSAFTIRLNSSTMLITHSDEKPSRNDSSYWQRPVFGSFRKHAQLPFEPSQYKCNDKHSIECQRKTSDFRAKVMAEFEKSLLNQSEILPNMYNVEYEPLDEMIKYNPTCMVLDAKLRMLTKQDAPFDRNKIGRMFPAKKLFGKKFLLQPRSCVIVSSAGSLHRSGLGSFIGNYTFLSFFILLWIAQKF